jgi:hypothetical protein
VEKHAPVQFKRFVSGKLKPYFLIKFIVFFVLFLFCLSLIYNHLTPATNGVKQPKEFPSEIRGVEIEVPVKK